MNLNDTLARLARMSVAASGVAALLACQGPGATTVPAGSPATKLPGASDGSGRIRLFEVARGDTRQFKTVPGRELTVVASAATVSPGLSPFKLSVGHPIADGAASAYSVASSRSQGASGEAPAFPFRHGFTDSNQALLDAAPAGGTAPRRLQSAEGPRAVGHVDSFWINTGNSQTTNDVQRQATLRRVSDHAYFYVDSESTLVDDGQLDQLVSEYEGKIYPRLTGVFGEPPKPGVDGEDRVFIVLSPAVDNFGQEKGLMGYFWSRDVLPTGSEHSNQKEAVFLTDALFNYPALTSFGTLAHELQHLITFSQKAPRNNYTQAEETWLDEGLSMYAMEVAGYGLPAGDKLIAKDLNEFQLKTSAYSLTEWSSNPHGFAYGQSYLFVRYMVDRFGPGIVSEILASDQVGKAGLETVLAKHGESFDSFFRAWTVANFVSGKPVAAGSVYQYKELDLAGNYGGFQLSGFRAEKPRSGEVVANLRPYGSAYYSFNAGEQREWMLGLPETSPTHLLGAMIVPGE